MMKIRRPALLLALLATLPLTSAFAEIDAKQIDSPIPFKHIARIHLMDRKGKNYEAAAAYPIFRTSTRLTRFVNHTIGAWQRKDFNDWLSDSTKALSGDPHPVGPYDYESTPSLTYYAPSRLISLRFDSYEFTGGAHGMSVIQSRSFGMVNGKPKELVLGDLFKPGSDYRKLVETQIFAKLKKDPNAEWVQDGTVKKLENDQFNNFTIAKDGVTWLFNQYEMGPYVVGQFEIKLSLKELGPDFRLDWLKK